MPLDGGARFVENFTVTSEEIYFFSLRILLFKRRNCEAFEDVERFELYEVTLTEDFCVCRIEA